MILLRHLPRWLYRCGIAAGFLVFFTPIALAAGDQTVAEYSTFHPTPQQAGTIRSWGHGYLRGIMKIWEAGFRAYHPEIDFKDDMVSSAAAMAGLYSQRADLGVLAREITPPEIAAYEKVSRQKITPVTVLVGSFGNQDKIMALGVFVNRDNPIGQLTFSQVDAIFGSERRAGAPQLIRHWSELGVTAPWSRQTIQLYSGLAFEAPGYFFSQTVMGGSVLWNCDLKQFDNVEDEKSRSVDAYQNVVDAVGANPRAIGIAGAGYKNPRAKLVALAKTAAGPYIPATPETVAALTYPLARPVRFYIHNGPAIATDPRLLEFLRYILSREGQQLVAQEGDFFALPPTTAAAELAKLPQIRSFSPP